MAVRWAAGRAMTMATLPTDRGRASAKLNGLAREYLPNPEPMELPNSREAEQGTLGCILLDPKFCAPILAKRGVGSDWFHDGRHAALFLLFGEMHGQGLPLDPITLAPRVAAMRDASIELNYVLDLQNPVPSAANLEWYLPDLEAFHQRREAIRKAREIIRLASDGADAADLSRVVRSLADSRVQSGGGLSIRRPDEILAMRFDEADCILGDRLLAKGQPMTILGAGGLGKSRLAHQLAACQIIGRPFLGLQTHGQPLKWLFLQGENSNRRLQDDLNALRALAAKNWPTVNEFLRFHTLEKDHDGFLNLDSPATIARISDALSVHSPDVVVFDTLNCFAIGDPNKDADMRETCHAISRLTKQGNPARSSVVLHHALTGRAGASRATGYDRASFGRNSKVLQAWTRGQINVAPGSGEDNESLVLSCGKCSNGREFPPFAARLNPETMIYEVDHSFDLAGWQHEVSGTKENRNVSVGLVADLCTEAMSKAALVKAIMQETGCGKTIAYRQIGRAEREKMLRKNPSTKAYVKA